MSSRTSMVKMGEHISFLRKKKNYTQRNLGDILDVSDKTISKWEKGIVAPDITILQALANTLDVSVEEILAGEKVSHINTIEALDIYSNMTKHKLVKSFIVFITLLAILLFFVFKIERYYCWNLDSLYLDGDISLKGYVLKNNKESKIVFNRIYYSKKEIQNTINSINIIVKENDDILYNENNYFDSPIDINSHFNNYVISIEVNHEINKNDLMIYFVVEDNNGSLKTYTYKFK